MATIGIDSQVDLGAAGFSDTSQHFIMDGIGTYTPSSAETVTEVGIQKRLNDSVNVEIGIYRVDTNALIGSAIVNSSAESTRVVTATSISLTSGVTYCVGFRFIGSSTAMISYSGAASNTSALTGASALANTFVENGVEDTKFGIFAITASSGPTVTISESQLNVGGTGYYGTTAGMGIVTSISGGEITSALVGSFTFDILEFENNVTYSEFGNVIFEVSDGTLTASDEVPLSVMSGYNSQIITSLSSSPDSIHSQLVGFTLKIGNTLYGDSSEITLYDDTTYAAAPTGTIYIWNRDVDTNVMNRITIINGDVEFSDGNISKAIIKNIVKTISKNIIH